MVGWICGGVAGLVLWAIVARIRLYRRLLSDGHFLALGGGLPALKQAALSRIIALETDAIRGPNDPRILRTDYGLAVLYTISEQATEFVHHCSVSVPGVHVAQGSLDLFLQFTLRSLGLPLASASFDRGAGNVHHANVVLSASEQTSLLGQPLLDTSPANLLALRTAVINGRT
jgi:hypothetical protein